MVELLKVQLFIMFMNHISRSEAGESKPSVDFLFLPVQSYLCWFEHVPVPFLVAQKPAYLWSAHHCKSAHQVLSVSPSKAGYQQTAALSCNCAIFAGTFYLNRCTHQKLESLVNSRPTCWSFFTGPKGHIFTWKTKREHDITYLLNDLNRHVSHTHVDPRCLVVFAKHLRPHGLCFYPLFEADVNCSFSTIVLIVWPGWIKTQMSGLRGLSLQTHKNTSVFWI